MQRALTISLALFLALGTGPALAGVTVHIQGAAPRAVLPKIQNFELSSTGDVGRRHRSQPTTTMDQPASSFLANGRPIQCETTEYLNQNGFFVGHEVWYSSYGSCPLLPVTFIDNVAPMPPGVRYGTGAMPLLLPVDDFDFANW